MHKEKFTYELGKLFKQPYMGCAETVLPEIQPPLAMLHSSIMSAYLVESVISKHHNGTD